MALSEPCRAITVPRGSPPGPSASSSTETAAPIRFRAPRSPILVGFSPTDSYSVWVNRDTGLIDYWDMKLTGSSPDEPPLTVTFRDYQRVGGLLVSTRREIASKKQTVRLEELQVLPEPPKGAFQ